MVPPNTWENIELIIKSRIIIDPVTNCWLWQGEKSHSGYGRLRVGYRKQMVHRISAMLYLGLAKWDADTLTLHKPICPNKHCCNPDHLYLGSGKDNWADVRKDKQWRTKHSRYYKVEEELTADDLRNGTIGDETD